MRAAIELAEPSTGALGLLGQPSSAELAGRQPLAEWPATCQSAEALLTRLVKPPFVLESRDKQADRACGLRLLVAWLGDQTGRTWQARWTSSGADAAGPTWREVAAKWLQATGQWSPRHHGTLVGALPVVIAADVVRPSLGWLAGGGPAAGGLLARNMAVARDPEGFAQLAALCDATPGVSATARGQVLYRASLILAAKGGTLREVTVGDVMELFDAQAKLLASSSGVGRTLFYRLLHDMGVLGRVPHRPCERCAPGASAAPRRWSAATASPAAPSGTYWWTT